MSAAKRPIMLGEQAMVGAAEIHRDMGSWNAFARVATPEYWAMDPANYGDITPEMVALADPDRFQKDLVGRNVNGEFSVGFRPFHEPYTRVALTESEYQLITRSPVSIGRAAVSHSLSGRVNEVPTQVDKDRATRHGIHILEAKLEGMRLYIGALAKDAGLLERYTEAATHHWMARGKEGRMRVEAQDMRDRIIGNMFVALRYQRNWTPDQEDLAKRSLDVRLFFNRGNNAHIQEWLKLFRLNTYYNGYKQALFSDRIWQTEKTIKQSKAK